MGDGETHSGKWGCSPDLFGISFYLAEPTPVGSSHWIVICGKLVIHKVKRKYLFPINSSAIDFKTSSTELYPWKTTTWCFVLFWRRFFLFPIHLKQITSFQRTIFILTKLKYLLKILTNIFLCRLLCRMRVDSCKT